MWQFITVNSDEVPQDLASGAQRLGTVSHSLTHRRYEFEVYIARRLNGSTPLRDRPHRWVTEEELDHYPLPRPHLKMLELARVRLSRRRP